MTNKNEDKTLCRYKVPYGCLTFVVIGFKFCRSNDKRRGDMCASLNGPEAPAGIEPAVEKGTLAASWTFLQSEVCPWYSSVRAQYGYGTVCVCARVLSHVPLFATPWNSPGKNTGVGCHFLLQRIFPARGSNPCLLCHWQWQADSYHCVTWASLWDIRTTNWFDDSICNRWVKSTIHFSQFKSISFKLIDGVWY